MRVRVTVLSSSKHSLTASICLPNTETWVRIMSGKGKVALLSGTWFTVCHFSLHINVPSRCTVAFP